MAKEASKIVSESVEKFTADFHKSIAGKQPGNFVSSALSAHTVLAMAAYGADGTTAQVMRKTLHLPEDDSVAHKGFQNFIDKFNNVSKVSLQLANKIYAAHDFEVKDKFKKITASYFRSESELVDFSKNDEAAKLINNWCDKKTKGKIQEILSPEDIDASVRMVLLNAVYFKGNWKNKFRESNTQSRPFHVTKNTTVEVPTMYIKEEFYYKPLPELNARLVAMPYENEDLYMVIIVPDEIDGLENIEQNLDKIQIDYDHIRNRSREIELYLPKFKIQSTHDLESHLSELGMGEIFTRTANFKQLCDKENILVSKVIQKAFIEVNEEGCEAAAVTGLKMMLMCMPPPPEVVKVDRPFIFKIVHQEDTLFSGHVKNPL